MKNATKSRSAKHVLQLPKLSTPTPPRVTHEPADILLPAPCIALLGRPSTRLRRTCRRSPLPQRLRGLRFLIYIIRGRTCGLSPLATRLRELRLLIHIACISRLLRRLGFNLLLQTPAPPGWRGGLDQALCVRVGSLSRRSRCLRALLWAGLWSSGWIWAACFGRDRWCLVGLRILSR